MNFRYALFWFLAFLTAVVAIFCTACGIYVGSKYGFTNIYALLDFVCAAINFYGLYGMPARYRQLKEMDATLASLDALIAELDKIQTERDQELMNDPNTPPAIKLVKKIEAERRNLK